LLSPWLRKFVLSFGTLFDEGTACKQTYTYKKFKENGMSVADCGR